MKRLLLFVLGLTVVALASVFIIDKRATSTGRIGSDQVHFDTVQDFLDAEQGWQEALEEIRNGPGPEEDRLERFDELADQRPDVEAAIDAAYTLLNAEREPAEALDLAQFLIEKTSSSARRSRAMLEGMNTIAKYDPDYTDWQKTLLMADVFTPPGVSAELDQFFEQFDQHVANQPVAQATSRYYAATRRMTLANWVRDNSDDRLAHRAEAERFADGLSLGVENETLVRRQPRGKDGEQLPYPTFAAAEQELLFQLGSLTVGGVLPNTVGRTVTGTSDELTNYRGKVVLLDFWATWCAPCIDALPKLANLKAELPAEAFEIISINTDASLDTLIEFQQQEPMPWIHWYAGEGAPILKEWSIRGFPTYLLIDQKGVLHAKQFVLNESLLDLIRSTLCDSDGAVKC